MNQLLSNDPRVLCYRDEDGRTPLHIAVLIDQCCLEIIHSLLAYGGSVLAEDLWGNSPLHLLLMGERETGVRPKAASALVEAGARLTAFNALGWTPLHLAAMLPSASDFLKHMLQASTGCWLDVQAGGGDTPLHIAAACTGNMEAVRYLLMAGASPSVKNTIGAAPADVAADAPTAHMLRQAILDQHDMMEASDSACVSHISLKGAPDTEAMTERKEEKQKGATKAASVQVSCALAPCTICYGRGRGSVCSEPQLFITRDFVDHCAVPSP